jgi:putative holliday junction resolvase
MNEGMRALGVDYGTVRVGLAISDELGIISMPLETVPQERAVERIIQVIEEKKVGIVILGLPKNMDGTLGPKAQEVQKFAASLSEKITVPIKLWDERLTTRGVERMLIEADVSRQNRKKVIDKLAAQQILQGYLDSQQ